MNGNDVDAFEHRRVQVKARPVNWTSLDQARAHSPSKDGRPSGLPDGPSKDERPSGLPDGPSRNRLLIAARGLDHAPPSSGMLRRYRRFFAVAAFLLLATPLVVGIVRPDSAASILKEGRYPAPAPKPPDSAQRLAVAAKGDRRLSQRPFRPAGEDDPPAQGSHSSGAAESQHRRPDRPQRADVLSGQRDGAAKRGPCAAGRSGGADGAPARRDARRSRQARRSLSGGHSAELFHHLPGRSAGLGSGPRQKDGIRSPARGA